ncbi:hypothetical protein SAMN04487860_101219 [Ruminococcus flavefaciens]|uniref:Uncharacterized protein n=1 Tax=Ruminococcus flavefaciens TaxID=1265 RepID=A0A1M7GCT5_RUMFL|nr:hypothetical protein SAMN04487860_101219 [Ruminococcus flavefaciens]
MNEYLCFMPISLDFTDCTDISEDNIDTVNNIGYKRRWKLVAYKRYKGIADLKRFIEVYSDKAPKYIPAIGVVIGTDDIKELIESDIMITENIFFTIDVTDALTAEGVLNDIRCLAMKAKIFFRNFDPDIYHSVIPEIRDIFGDSDNVMFESDYLSSASDRGISYIDVNKADISKIADLSRYLISTSYNDAIISCSDDEKVSSDWEMFRKRGIFNMIRLLRDRCMSEQEIAECTYYKFRDFFGVGR